MYCETQDCASAFANQPHEIWPIKPFPRVHLDHGLHPPAQTQRATTTAITFHIHQPPKPRARQATRDHSIHSFMTTCQRQPRPAPTSPSFRVASLLCVVRAARATATSAARTACRLTMPGPLFVVHLLKPFSHVVDVTMLFNDYFPCAPTHFRVAIALVCYPRVILVAASSALTAPPPPPAVTATLSFPAPFQNHSHIAQRPRAGLPLLTVILLALHPRVPEPAGVWSVALDSDTSRGTIILPRVSWRPESYSSEQRRQLNGSQSVRREETT